MYVYARALECDTKCRYLHTYVVRQINAKFKVDVDMLDTKAPKFFLAP